MDIGHILTSIPPIIENIFKHLKGRDLGACAQVCTLWNRIAQTELKSRQNISWFFQGQKCPVHHKVHSGSQECGIEILTEMENDMHEQLDVLKIAPSFCIAFATTYLVDSFEKYFPSFDYFKKPQRKRMREEDPVRKRSYISAVMKKLRRYLPMQCRMAFCVAPAVIGSDENIKTFEIEEGCAISGIFFPDIEGLEVHKLPVDSHTCNIANLIPEGTSIKCLLVFLTPRGISFGNRIVQSCLVKENCKVAVGGAIVDRTDCLTGTVLAICGSKVEAASVVVRAKENKEEELETKLKLFQETGFLEHRCYAFMFSCVARGYYYYREYNFESAVFHKLYPHVPLIGLFGNGEVGLNYFPHMPKENKILQIGKLKHCTKKYVQNYASVFVMISIKM